MNVDSEASDDEKEKENVAIEKLDSWFIYVHVHDKVITISCGDASQKVKWAAHVGIARWDEGSSQGWKKLGIPTSVRLYQKDGEEVDMNLSIQEICRNGDHLYIETSLNPNETSFSK